MDYKQLQKQTNEFKESSDVGIHMRNVKKFSNNKGKIILSRIFKSNSKEENEDLIADGIPIYMRFNRNILGLWLEEIGFDIKDKKIKEEEFRKLMKLPMYILELAKDDEQKDVKEHLRYFADNLWKVNDVYIIKFKNKLSDGTLNINDIIDLGNYFINNFDKLNKDSQFELYYRNFNVYVRDFVTIKDKVFIEKYEGFKDVFRINGIILKDLEKVYK